MLLTNLSSSDFFKKISPNLTSLPNKRKILLIAFLISCVVTLLNGSWMYNRLGELDHFAYLGAAVYFPRSILSFPNHPISELVPIYLPTALLYHLFVPAVANFIKDQLFLIASLFLFMRISLFLTHSMIATLCVTFILSGYYYFLVSVGSDYTDSFIQLFCMTNLYFLTNFFENKSKPHHQQIILFILGITSALMFSSGVLSIVYIINLILLFLLLNLADENGASIIRLLKNLAVWLLGIALTIALISAYLSALTGGFYMKNNLIKLFYFVGGAGQFHPLLEWLPFASWLILPFAITLYFLISFCIELYNQHGSYREIFSFQSFSRIKLRAILFPKTLLSNSANKGTDVTQTIENRQRAFAFFLIAILGSLIFIQLVVKQWSLQFMYFSQVNFIYFLGLAIILSKNIQAENNLKNIIFVSLTALISAFLLNLLDHRTFDFEMIITNYFKNSPTVLPWLALVLFFLTLFFFYSSKLLNKYCLILLIFLFQIFSYSELHGGYCCLNTWKIDYLDEGRSTSEKFFNANFKLAYFLNDLDQERGSDIWFDEQERLGMIFRQVFSMNYFNFSQNLINKSLPKLGDYSGPPGSSGHSPLSTRSLVIFSEDPKKIEQGLKNLDVELGTHLDYEIFAIKIGEVTLYAYKTKPLSKPELGGKSRVL